MSDLKQPTDGSLTGLLRQMSAQDLSLLGSGSVCYVRTIHLGRTLSYALFTADGTPIGTRDSMDAVRDLAWENDLSIVAVN